jgi:hypothetical protein
LRQNFYVLQGSRSLGIALNINLYLLDTHFLLFFLLDSLLYYAWLFFSTYSFYTTIYVRLYNSCPWEDRAIRKLIADGKIAARLKGAEYRSTNCQQECPICFLYYDEVNITKCCNANLCSECFLQVRPQKEKQPCCPFCNAVKFTVSIAPKLSESEIDARQKEEQTVIEARIRAEQNHDDSPKQLHKKKAAVAPDSSGNRFGSELEKDERFQLLKKRTESFTSSEEGLRTPQKDAETIKSFAMTPEERRRLEEEMRAQHAHPLALRVEAEAYERRLQNEQAYYRSNSAGGNASRSQRAADLFRSNSSNMASATRRLRYRGARDWNQIVEAFENGSNGEVNSLDDLVVLEAAILLSMDEEARREREEEAAAAPASFDAARHAGGGFPLVRSLLDGAPATSHGSNGEASGSASAAAAGSASDNVRAALRSLNETRQQLARTAGLGASARRRGVPDAALDTASLMMRGISEEEQIAMAIAASLQDQNNGNEDARDTSGESEDSSSSSSSEGSNTSGDRSEESESSFSSNTDAPVAAAAAGNQNESSESSPEAGNGDGAMTISDLARVVTDSGRDGNFGATPSGNEIGAASNGEGTET